MHILFLTQIVPYPPDAGPRIKTWNVLRYLAGQGHRISLATFVRPEEEPYLEHVSGICSAIYPVRMRRSRLADGFYALKSLFTGKPFLIERDNLSAMRRVVAQVLAGDDVDLIEADQLTMAQFALEARGNRSAPPVIFDSHNATFKILERSLNNVNALLRLPLEIEFRRLKRYEINLVQRCDHTLTVTQQDRQIFIENCRLPSDSQQISAVPIAVDTQALQPLPFRQDSVNIVTLGTLTYPPNADGIRWFLRDVFPVIYARQPQVTLTIIGKKPPADFFTLAAPFGDAVQITGYVPDLTPYLAQAAVMAVPVLAGSGMRVRILEAFARGIPVVTTPIGLEGIEAGPQEVRVAESKTEFAAAVLQLLQDPAERSQMAVNARRLAETRYDWQVALQNMNRVYARLIPSFTGGPNEALS